MIRVLFRRSRLPISPYKEIKPYSRDRTCNLLFRSNSALAAQNCECVTLSKENTLYTLLTLEVLLTSYHQNNLFASSLYTLRGVYCNVLVMQMKDADCATYRHSSYKYASSFYFLRILDSINNYSFGDSRFSLLHIN